MDDEAAWRAYFTGAATDKHTRFLPTHDIASDTMTPNKLKKLRGEFAELRRAPQKALALEKLAKSLGRKKVKRGKEPNWESARFPDLPPLSIPHHGGKDLSIGVRNGLLIQLQDDIDAWENLLEDEVDA